MLGLAAEVAFWLFLSLLPLVAVAGLIAAKLTVGHDAAVGSWLGAVPPSTRALVRRELAQLAASSGRTVGPVGTLIFVWLASSGIHSLFDAFDAMTCERPYRQAQSSDEALAELHRESGGQFDPAIARIFRELVVSGAADEVREAGTLAWALAESAGARVRASGFGDDAFGHDGRGAA